MKKEIKIVFSISFIFYLLVLVFILFLGFRGYRYDLPFLEYMKNSSNFVPFKTINTYFQAILDRSINLNIPIKNLFGNFILFLPMGIYLPFFIKKTNKVMVFSISMIVILFIIEVMQLVTRKGSFDVDDFILNMPGALIGFGIWRTKFVQNLLK